MHIIMGEFVITPMTGSVSWTGDVDPTREDMATRLGKAYQVWNRVRENNSKTWVSEELVMDLTLDSLKVTVLVEPDSGQVHLLCPISLGCHHVLLPETSGDLDHARAVLCVRAVDDGDVCVSGVGQLCRDIISSDTQLARDMGQCARVILKCIEPNARPESQAGVVL